MQVIPKPSPNFSLPRESPRDIRYIILHATASPLESSLSWLCDPKSKVSAHYVIARDGATYRLVECENIAWHSGKSCIGDDTEINAHSIGIELVNWNDGFEPYPPRQQDSLTELVKGLLIKYKLKKEDIYSHAEVATPNGRKTDPAGFPWIIWRDTL